MGRLNPLETTAKLVVVQSTKMTVIGTAFAYRNKNHYLTASHCIPRSEKFELVIVPTNFPALEGAAWVEKVDHHPTADLAVLTVRFQSELPIRPFVDIAIPRLGDDYVAFGFPAEAVLKGATRPTPRLFKGNYQRFFEHTSHMKYTYYAAELSAPCPDGLSGGPLFHRPSEGTVAGLITESLQVATVLDEEVKVTADGATERTEYRNVISYGVAVLLHPLAGWLAEMIPVRESVGSKLLSILSKGPLR